MKQEWLCLAERAPSSTTGKYNAPVGLSNHTVDVINKGLLAVVGRQGGTMTQRRFGELILLHIDPVKTMTYHYEQTLIQPPSRSGKCSKILRDETGRTWNTFSESLRHRSHSSAPQRGLKLWPVCVRRTWLRIGWHGRRFPWKLGGWGTLQNSQPLQNGCQKQDPFSNLKGIFCAPWKRFSNVIFLSQRLWAVPKEYQFVTDGSQLGHLSIPKSGTGTGSNF